MILDGLGYCLANLFSNSGSDRIEDYQISYYQLGVDRGLLLAITDVYELNEAFSLDTSYGVDTPVLVEQLEQITTSAGAFEKNYLAHLETSSTTRSLEGSTKVRIEIGELTANGIGIEEIGIFVKNPDGNRLKPRPVLIAYDTFDNTFNKEEDLAFTINWNITFDE